ncbi:MAG: septum formation initiator family protein [Candidatus Berkelbacteria bacterium]|nr:septum formation initiator family protein [Candidatus Berkelbacteria bacterium]
MSREFMLKALLIGLFIFAVYSNINLIVRNHKLGQILREKRTQTAQQAFNNSKLKLLIAYYQTPSFQEVEARRRLGLKKPDETVYTIKGLATDTDQNPGLSDNLYNDIQPASPTTKTNIQLWWQYFFGE